MHAHSNYLICMHFIQIWYTQSKNYYMYLYCANIREIKQILAKSMDMYMKVRFIQASKFSNAHLFSMLQEEDDQSRYRMIHLPAAGSPKTCAILPSLMTITLNYRGKKSENQIGTNAVITLIGRQVQPSHYYSDSQPF